jgi:NADH:ubiquinone oxidoreductase subunit 5 (subunit L)/multisubunit Na+/H+ antiporter MnhA subunit
MYILVLLLPLLSFFITTVLGFYLGRKLSSIFSVSLLIASFFISLLIFYEVLILGVDSVFDLFT